MASPKTHPPREREAVVPNAPIEGRDSEPIDTEIILLEPAAEVISDAAWEARRRRVASRLGTYEGPGWEAVLQGIEQENQ